MDSSAPEYEVIIVGGGVAGLAAGLTLGRARRRVLIIDSGTPRNARAGRTHGFLTRDGEPPRRLLELGVAEVRAYDVTTVHAVVRSVAEGSTGRRIVTTTDGRSWTAERILLTTGLVDVLPDVDGLAERWGIDVVHCPYCFGWELRDQPVGILATRQGAYGQAVTWSQWTRDLVVFQHTAPPPDRLQAAQLEALGVPVIAGTVARVEDGPSGMRRVRLDDGRELVRRAVVVPSALESRVPDLSGVGLEPVVHDLGIGTYIAATADGRTSSPGVWVAGNAFDVTLGVLQAAASGTTAAAAINSDLTADHLERSLSG